MMNLIIVASGIWYGATRRLYWGRVQPGVAGWVVSYQQAFIYGHPDDAEQELAEARSRRTGDELPTGVRLCPADAVPCDCCGRPARLREAQEWGFCKDCANAGCYPKSAGDGDVVRGAKCPLMLNGGPDTICMCLGCGKPLHRSEPLTFIDNTNPGAGGCHARCVDAYLATKKILDKITADAGLPEMKWSATNGELGTQRLDWWWTPSLSRDARAVQVMAKKLHEASGFECNVAAIPGGEIALAIRPKKQ